ncbi:Yup8H12 [Thalassoporum mexicanum PCC 7367]|uniref:RIP metalloprotease RseP n=1 Tax=Thalassoporum mexicanum TaxID=3457544 RepID=UPI00029F862F|nr:RIP metalloprotease RseP [Pseudanabaena sp. PCC 7367]AFY71548.1 Yup8H12 [Pseudanabaena sp. PCC 7367]
MTILAPILVIAVLIFVHELGHFMAARWQGIHVNKFSIGFGPVLWKYQGEMTEYAVRAIPLGGFVGFPDKDEDSDIPDDDPDLLKNRSIGDRAIVFSAGVAANLIFAYLVLLVMVISVGVGTVDKPGVRVIDLISNDSPAAIAGLQADDVITAANGETFGTDLATLERFQKIISSHGDRVVDLKVQRNGENLDLPIVPSGEPNKGRIGIRLDYTSDPHRRPVQNIWEAIGMAAQKFERLCLMTVQGLQKLVTNFSDHADQVAGPVAIVAMGSQLAKSDFASLFDFTAIISINLAVINILPLPALDGGQLLFLLIEALRFGKPLPERFQEYVMQGGLVVLLGLGVFMIFRDSINLLQ